MVQVINTGNPQGKIAEMLGMSLGQGLGSGINTYFANKALEDVINDESTANQPISAKMGKLQSALAPFGEKGQELLQNRMKIEQQDYVERQAKEQQKQALEKEQRLFQHQKELQAQKDISAKEIQAQKDIAAGERAKLRPPPGGRGAQPIEPEINKKIGEILGKSKGMTADELKFAFDEAGIPPPDYAQYIENRRRTEEQGTKTSEERRKALRAETLPIRTELAKKAQIAEQSIRNKSHLIDLIEKGDLNDPTVAALAEALPLNLGKRLLSNDTIEYKGGLVEEYGDLKNIFAGATRVKEIELLEQKIADIYLTDDQKKAILKSRINAEKAHIIRAEAAAKLEDREDLGVLQFNKEVEKLAKPELDKLFDQILDEQKSIIQDAENRKKMPLDINDPDDKKIMMQIFKEAGGDKTKAKELTKKKGYTIKGAR